MSSSRWSLLTLAARIIWSAGLDLVLAASFLITWYHPDYLGEFTVRRFVVLMLLEFLVVHSTGFLGAIGAADSPRRVRALQYGGLFLFYLVFALGLTAGLGSFWPVAGFAILTLSKIPNVVLRPPDADGQMIVMANWAAMTALYLAGIFLTAVAEVPPNGVTPEVIAAQGFDVGGLWTEEPHRVMAFGAFYFTGLALLSIVNELAAYFIARKKAAASRN